MMASAAARLRLDKPGLTSFGVNEPVSVDLFDPCSLARLEVLSLDLTSKSCVSWVSNSIWTSKASGSTSESMLAFASEDPSSMVDVCRDWDTVITDDIDCGRPVSDQFPLSAASKKGDAK